MKLRQKLVDLTAASGVITNLQIAMEASGIKPYYTGVSSAVKAGHLHVLKWLHGRGWADFSDSLLVTAARHGHWEVFVWLLDTGMAFPFLAVGSAAKSGDAGMVRRLLEVWHEERRPMEDMWDDDKGDAGLLDAVAWGCDLPSLKQLFAEWVNGALSPEARNEDVEDEDGNLHEDKGEGAAASDFGGIEALGQVEYTVLSQQSRLQRKWRTAQCRVMELSKMWGPRSSGPVACSGGKRGPGHEEPPGDAEPSAEARRELADAQAAADELEDQLCQLVQRLKLLRTVDLVLSPSHRADCIAHAAASPTPDWRAKIDWLERLGSTLGPDWCERARVAQVALSLLPYPEATATVMCRGSTALADAAMLSSRGAPPAGSYAESATGAQSRSGQPQRPQQPHHQPPQTEVQVVWQYQVRGDNSVERLRWLKERGYPAASIDAAKEAAEHANVPAFRYVAAELQAAGQRMWWDTRSYLWEIVVMKAGYCGSWKMLEELRALGIALNGHHFLRAAAQGGHLRVLQWWDQVATEQQQPQEQQEQRVEHSMQAAPLDVTPTSSEAPSEAGPEWMGTDVWNGAASSGNLEMLQWMYGRCNGRPRWGEDTVKCGVNGGNVEALEWLVERGCPMGDSSRLYKVAALQGDVATLRCLRRLGCPWSDTLFSDCILSPASPESDRHLARCSAEVLMCLLEEGCPVDWPAAEAKARERRQFGEESRRRDAIPDKAVELVLRLAQQQWQSPGRGNGQRSQLHHEGDLQGGEGEGARREVDRTSGEDGGGGKEGWGEVLPENTGQIAQEKGPSRPCTGDEHAGCFVA